MIATSASLRRQLSTQHHPPVSRSRTHTIRVLPVQGRVCAASGQSVNQATCLVSQEEQLGSAWRLLKDYTQKMFRGGGAQYTATPAARENLKATLLLAYTHAWPPAGWVPLASTSKPTQEPQQPPQEPSICQQSPPDPAPSPAGAAGVEAQGVQPPPSSPPPSALNALPSADMGSGPMVMLGLMAADIFQATRALRDYCDALGLPHLRPECRVSGVTQLAEIQGPVYLKYNSLSQVCYASPYFGRERGVLLQLGQQQFGHFPLGMFDEDMQRPAPII
ncbi:hypothetical protein V8C86DRAFT_2894255 [Haematococcus lacustris]